VSFESSRDKDRPIITFATSVELSMGNLDTIEELLRAAIETKPQTFNNAIHVTSADDGTHGDESFHYIGCAYDLRIVGKRHGAIVVPENDNDQAYRNAQQVLARWWASRIEKRLRGRWQIIYEDDHIHCERDPQ
jgi:hypothetical protein